MRKPIGTKIVQKLIRTGRLQTGDEATPSSPAQRIRQMIPVTSP